MLQLSLVLLLPGVPLWAQAPAPPAPVHLVSVRSARVLYGLREPVTGRVTVANDGKTPQPCTITAWLESDLDTTSLPQTSTLTLGPGQTAEASFQWAGGLTKYGHALQARVFAGGRPVGAGRDFFNVCDNFWNVALPYAQGFLYAALDQKMMPRTDTAWAETTVESMRKDYYNCFEHFFWAQDDFLGLVPTVPVWWSGQARYRESTFGIKTLIEKSHEAGIKAITYAKLTGGGTFGMEMARRHPEWVWQYGGTLSVGRDVQQIHDWDETAGKPWGGWVPVNYNMNDPAVVEIGIKALSDSAGLFGWDGARWDGTFEVQGEVYDLSGKRLQKLTPAQVDAQNAANMRHTKEEISRAHPQFRYGYNWTQVNWKQSMATAPLESTELCRGGGMIMNEYINQAAAVQHPLHQWAVYGPSVADDVEAIKKLGGYYGPILSSPNTPDGKYTNVFAYAAGAHPYYHHLWGDFVTRYSAFLWDNALARVDQPQKLVQVSTGPWWEHWVFRRPLDATHEQLIIHLINPPAHPNVGDSPKPEDMPAPLTDVQVRLLPAGCGGWKPVSAWILSPEPALHKRLPPPTGRDAGQWRVPEVVLWSLLVIDLQKGGK
jgi:hypothetical protein